MKWPYGMIRIMAVGTIKFWKASRGWGAIVTNDAPGEVWLHFSAFSDTPQVTVESEGTEIFREGDPLGELAPGSRIEFESEPCEQDSFRFRATTARRL